ncbi:hypothetical protein QSI_0347 [Clostridioides difficile P28]|nr:hypothetical protein QSI_0347 [Clostridioides difficile P28]
MVKKGIRLISGSISLRNRSLVFPGNPLYNEDVEKTIAYL